MKNTTDFLNSLNNQKLAKYKSFLYILVEDPCYYTKIKNFY